MRLKTRVLLLSSSFLPATLSKPVFDKRSSVGFCGERYILEGEVCCTTPDGGSNICGYGTSCCFYGCCNFGSKCSADGQCVPISEDITTRTGSSSTISSERGSTTSVVKECSPLTADDQCSQSNSQSHNGSLSNSSVGGGMPPPASTTGGSSAPTSAHGGSLHPTLSTNKGSSPTTSTNQDNSAVTTETIGDSESAPTSTTSKESLFTAPLDGSSSPPTTTTGESSEFPPTQTSISGDGSIPATTGKASSEFAPTSAGEGNSASLPATMGSESSGTPSTSTTKGISGTAPDSIGGASSEVPPTSTTTNEGSLSPTSTTENGSDSNPTSGTSTVPPQSTTGGGVSNPISTSGGGSPPTTTMENGSLTPTFFGGGASSSSLTSITGLESGPTTTGEGNLSASTAIAGVTNPSSETTGIEGTTAPGDTTDTGGLTDPTRMTIGTTTTEDGITATGSSTTTGGPLITYATWPVVTIAPVTSDTSDPEHIGGPPVLPCRTWFFFICISWINGPIFSGWKIDLPPGIYPPGPPPSIVWPPGIEIDGILPPWPEITIGNDNKPTYSSEPTSCETESATINVITTSYGVSISGSVTVTTASQVFSTSDVILGCDVEDEGSSTTLTGATSTATELIVTMSDDSNDPPPTEVLNTAGDLASSIYAYIDSYWSFLAAPDSTTLSTVTSAATTTSEVIPSTTSTESSPSTMSTESITTDIPLPTLTEITLSPPTTLPFQTSDGSSCVSTATTSVCVVPNQPCESSLSCASWVPTQTSTELANTVSEAPVPTNSWTLVIYQNKCNEDITNYLSLEGFGSQGPNEICINLNDPNLPLNSDNSNSCTFFTNGGFDRSSCSEATFNNPGSFIIKNGFCTVFADEGCPSNGVNPGIDSSVQDNCSNLEPKFLLPDIWRSISCFAFPE